jgi:hypothetical protein
VRPARLDLRVAVACPNDRGVLGDLPKDRRLVVELVEHPVALAEKGRVDLADDREHAARHRTRSTARRAFSMPGPGRRTSRRQAGRLRRPIAM